MLPPTPTRDNPRWRDVVADPGRRRASSAPDLTRSKRGFFAKVAVIDSPFYRESKKRYSRLLREYIRDLEPADVCDVHLIEFVVKGLLDLERLWSVQQALTLERHIPLSKNDAGGLSREIQDLLAKSIPVTRSGIRTRQRIGTVERGSSLTEGGTRAYRYAKEVLAQL